MRRNKKLSSSNFRRAIESRKIAFSKREKVPFKVISADEVTELSYSFPLFAKTHNEMKVLGKLPWFEKGKPLRNWMLHEIDFYDKVEKIWESKWGAEGIGKLREVLVSRPTENETRKVYSKEWQYYSSAVGKENLSKLLEQFDEYYKVLKHNGVRVNYAAPLLLRWGRTAI